MRLLLVPLLVILLWPSMANAESPQAYRAALAEALQLVEQAERAGGSAGRDAFAAAAATLTDLREVTVDDGSVVTVDLSPFVAELERATPRGAEVAAGLRSLLRVLDAQPTPADFEQTSWSSLKTVLERPELRPRQPAPWWVALGGFLEPLAELWYQVLAIIARLLEMAGRAFAAGSYGIGAIGLLVLAAILFFVVGRMRGGILPGAELRERAASGRSLSAADALQLASASAERRDWRAAVRYEFLATLISLRDEGLLPSDRSLTDREHVRRLADRPALARTLEDLVEAFEPLWYGRRPVEAHEYHRVRELGLAAREVGRA